MECVVFSAEMNGMYTLQFSGYVLFLYTEFEHCAEGKSAHLNPTLQHDHGESAFRDAAFYRLTFGEMRSARGFSKKGALHGSAFRFRQ